MIRVALPFPYIYFFALAATARVNLELTICKKTRCVSARPGGDPARSRQNAVSALVASGAGAPRTIQRAAI